MTAASPATAAPAAGGANAPANANNSGSNTSKSKPHSRGAIWVAKSELAKIESQPPVAKSEGALDNENGSGKKASATAPEDATKKVVDQSPAKVARKNEDSRRKGNPKQQQQQQQQEKDKAPSNSWTAEQRRENATSTAPQSLARQISLSKLNAAAAVFVPKISSSLPSSLGGFQAGQPGVISLPHSSLAPLLDVDDSLEAQQNPASVQKPVALTDELRAQIVQQAEFYFSDGNLSTDSYLMKFVKKDPDGLVPISLVGSFKKMKILTKNHAAIAAALRTSSKLIVSDDGKRVRRAEPLEDVSLDEIQSRTVVAENLPTDHSVKNLEKLFGTVGTVKSVRVCEPETVNGVSQMVKHKVDRLISNKLHALVEYETLEQAEKAVAELTDQRNWRSGLHVRLLVRRIYPASKQHNHQHAAKVRKNAPEASEGAEDDAADGVATEHENAVDDEVGADAAGAADGGVKRSGRGVGRGAGRGRGRGRGLLNGLMLGTSPQLGSSLSDATSVVSKPPPGPRMPDGTKGFTLGRGRDRTLVFPASSS